MNSIKLERGGITIEITAASAQAVNATAMAFLASLGLPPSPNGKPVESAPRLEPTIRARRKRRNPHHLGNAHHRYLYMGRIASDVLAKEIVNAVHEHGAKLSERGRAVLLATYRDGLTTKGIAALTGLMQSNISAHRHIALRKLGFKRNNPGAFTPTKE